MAPLLTAGSAPAATSMRRNRLGELLAGYKDVREGTGKRNWRKNCGPMFGLCQGEPLTRRLC